MRRAASILCSSRVASSRQDAEARRTRAPERRPRRRPRQRRRSSATGGCTEVKRRPRARTEARSAEGAARPREDLQARLQDELRLVHGHARPRVGPGDRRVARLAREGGLLRRHRLPPDRAGLRDPGRRPDADRRRAAPATRRSTHPPADARYVKGVVAMAKTAGRGAGDVGEPVLRRHGGRRRPAAGLRDRRQGDGGHRRVERIGKLGDPADGAADAAGRDRSVTVEEQ